jgi:hypothetical protein
MTLRFRLLIPALLAAVALTASALADEKPKTKKSDKLTLEDVIFDAQYLHRALGAKTLVAGHEKTGAIPIEALNKAGISEKTQVFALPDEAAKPVLKSSIAPTFPQSYRFRREPSTAEFFLFVGADGAVKTLHCYETNDQVFAIIAADALIKWRYTPAKIGTTAVPVLVPVHMKFDESDAAKALFRGPKPPFSVPGNPSAPPPVRPGGKQSGPP